MSLELVPPTPPEELHKTKVSISGLDKLIEQLVAIRANMPEASRERAWIDIEVTESYGDVDTDFIVFWLAPPTAQELAEREKAMSYAKALRKYQFDQLKREFEP